MNIGVLMDAQNGDVPQVRIQAGTPLPSIGKDRQKNGESRIPRLKSNIPNYNALPARTNSSSIINGLIKTEVGSDSACNSMVPHPPRQSMSAASSDIFKRPSASTISHTTASYLKQEASLKLPDGLNANLSPTPSEISNIRMTPHYGTVLTPTSEHHRSGISSPRTPQLTTFLEPFPVNRPDWNAFKILPSVNGHGEHDNPPPGSSLSNYQTSNISLSPFPQFDFSPAASIFSSPRHSARSNKKRALSISPLSADGIDINSIIRTSPTSLAVYLNGSSSRASTANKSRLSPFSNSLMGNQGHLNPKHVIMAFPHNYGNVKDEYLTQEQVHTTTLEQSGHPQAHHSVQGGNQMIIQHHQAQHFDTLSQANHHHNQHQHNISHMQVNTSAPMAMDYQPKIEPAHQPTPYPHSQDNSFYHPEQQMAQIPQRPPLLPRPGVSLTPRRPPIHPSNQPQHDSDGAPLYECSEEEDEEENDPKNYLCKWIDCNQVFDSKDELVKHVEKSHIDQRKGEDFTCYWSDCKRDNKPFNARYKLLIHMRVHTGERPNKCTHPGCDKAFSRLENLKIHSRSHTGERPYKCTFQGCVKAFSNSSDRAKHQRTHVDTKPYACQIVGCTKRYTDPSSLRKHVKNHKQTEQQQRKKLRSNESGYSSEGLGDCLNITRLQPEGSPMSIDSQGSLPGTRADFYPASLQFSLVQSTMTGKIMYKGQPAQSHKLSTIYSSAHSSRSGTANGYSHQPSPISMNQSMVGSPMAAISHSPYPVQSSPMPTQMQPSPGHSQPSRVSGPLMMQHSPLPQTSDYNNTMTTQAQPSTYAMPSEYSYANGNEFSNTSVLPPISNQPTTQTIHHHHHHHQYPNQSPQIFPPQSADVRKCKECGSHSSTGHYNMDYNTAALPNINGGMASHAQYAPISPGVMNSKSSLLPNSTPLLTPNIYDSQYRQQSALSLQTHPYPPHTPNHLQVYHSQDSAHLRGHSPALQHQH